MSFHRLREPRVYIPNLGFHDYTKAQKWGKLVFLTRGTVDRFEVGKIARSCADAMAEAESDDYLMITSLSVINSIASGILSRRFGRVNFLLHDPRIDDYYLRSVDLTWGIEGAEDVSGQGVLQRA